MSEPYRYGLSGYVPVRDNFRLDYCAQLAVSSLLPICEEVIIVDAGSTDETLPFFQDWAKREPKIRIVNYVLPPLPTPDEVERDDPNRPKGDPLMLIPWLNCGRKACRYNYQITLDADEVLDPASYSAIMQGLRDGRPLWAKRVNYWGDPQHEAPHGTVCGERVVRFGPTELEMCSDEPRPQGEPLIRSRASDEYVDRFQIFHLGFLRRQEAFLKKSRITQALIHNTYDPRLRQAEQTGESWVKLSPFPEGRALIPRYSDRFPEDVKAWLRERGYQVA